MTQVNDGTVLAGDVDGLPQVQAFTLSTLSEHASAFRHWGVNEGLQQ